MLNKKLFSTAAAPIYLIVFIGFLFGLILFSVWTITTATQESLVLLEISAPLKRQKIDELRKRQERLARHNLKGIYLTAYSAGNDEKITAIIDLIERTELNAVVIDIKDYAGKVLYDSAVPPVVELGLADNRLGDVKALLNSLHRADIYVIARQTVFQDPILAEKKPDWALKNKNGGQWRDYKGLAWVDPANRAVWDYNLAIAREAIKFGFEEINFDYVRFPSDGDMSVLQYNHSQREKYEVMAEFFDYLDKNLDASPVNLSLDFFGFALEKTGTDDMNIGQRLDDALDKVDGIYPMMYPSHYPDGHLGLSNPAEHPAVVIKNGLELGTPRFAGKKAVLRPWLQAFNLGAIYDAEKIRAQIDMTESYTDAGWFLWNAANRYSEAGLKLVETGDRR